MRRTLSARNLQAKYIWRLQDSGLRVPVPNNRILTQTLHYNSYYPKPRYLIIGYLGPLGRVGRFQTLTCAFGQASGSRLQSDVVGFVKGSGTQITGSL